MEVKCEYCGSLIPDNVRSCPNCGAPNTNMNRAAAQTPKTIAELKQWYQDQNLPPYESTRFFIGINYKEPKAFGIYKDGETFVVYKNKADGTRSIRYRGTDEDYAVNELYLKLRSEILHQKELQQGKRQKSTPGASQEPAGRQGFGFNGEWVRSVFQLLGIIAGIVASVFLFVNAVNGSVFLTIGAAVLAFLVFVIGRKLFRTHKKAVLLVALGVLVAALLGLSIVGKFRLTPRYYRYDDLWYVWYNDDYYLYDTDLNDYTPLEKNEVPAELSGSADTWRVDAGTLSDNGVHTFTDPNQSGSSWIDSIDFSSNNDHDYSWDSNDDWDIGGIDWDDDW